MELRREWLEKDYYKTLGVPERATANQIAKAYRKLAKRFHPDRNPGDDTAESRFKATADAYAVLGDTKNREAYDKARRLGTAASGLGAENTGSAFSDMLRDFMERDVRQQAHYRRDGRGHNIATDLRLDFVDAVTGWTGVIPVTADRPCRDCHGTGTKPAVCEFCGGTGTTEHGIGYFSKPCPNCSGTVKTSSDPCSGCSGSGTKTYTGDVKIRIPAGISDGQLIKLKGRGMPGVNGGEPGDLYIRVQVRPHRLFEREGNNLTITVPVTFAEAALGADIRVPTLNGTTVTFRVPPGTVPGTNFRVRGNGSASGADLIVAMDVVIPRNPSNKERAAIEALAEATPDNPRAYLEA